MRSLKIILIAGGLLFLTAIFGVIYFLFIRPLTLPVYHQNQQPSIQQPNFMATTLDLGNKRFISDASEFPLEMTADSVGWQAMIGRTQDGMDVYAIPGQDPQDYLMVTTEMFPAIIFRNAALPSVQMATTHFDAIRLLTNPGSGPHHAETRDSTILTEVIDCMTRPKTIAQNGTATSSASLHLISDALPGLSYLVYASSDASGRVFLAERQAPEDWIPAGPAFTSWFQQAVAP